MRALASRLIHRSAQVSLGSESCLWFRENRNSCEIAAYLILRRKSRVRRRYNLARDMPNSRPSSQTLFAAVGYPGATS